MGPGSYNVKFESKYHGEKVQMVAPSNVPQLAMYDHYRVKSRDTPGPNLYKKNHVFTEERPKQATIHYLKRQRGWSLKDSRAGPHSHVMPKSNEPGPGHYKNLENSMAVTESRNKEFMIPKSKRATFIDRLEESKRPVPGVGSYAKYESAFDKLSSPLVSLKRRR